MSGLTLYSADAPNPHVVEMFIRFAKLDVTIVRFDLDAGENRSEAFLTKNPSGQVPLLELENGTCITEVTAICEFLAEVFPDENQQLIGLTAEQRAINRMWFRRVDLLVCEPLENSFRFSVWADHFRDKMFVSETAAPALRDQANYGLDALNNELAAKPYIAGGQLTLVDVFLFGILRYFIAVGFVLNPKLSHVLAWQKDVENSLGVDIIG